MRRRTRKSLHKPMLQPIHPHTERIKNISMTIDREHMVFKTGRMSRDNPEWMQTTLHYYRKGQYRDQKADTLQPLDVFNNRKSITSGRNEDFYFSRMSESKGHDSAFVTDRWAVSPKIGHTDRRDFTIRKPILKVGNCNLYVDTYSPF